MEEHSIPLDILFLILGLIGALLSWLVLRIENVRRESSVKRKEIYGDLKEFKENVNTNFSRKHDISGHLERLERTQEKTNDRIDALITTLVELLPKERKS